MCLLLKFPKIRAQTLPPAFVTKCSTILIL